MIQGPVLSSLRPEDAQGGWYENLTFPHDEGHAPKAGGL
jgi:hypothetical protein